MKNDTHVMDIPGSGLLALVASYVTEALKALVGAESLPGLVQLSLPLNLEMGDIACGCFNLGKELQVNPAEAAKRFAAKLRTDGLIKQVQVRGPYVNLFLDRQAVSQTVLNQINDASRQFGTSTKLQGQTVMVEYLSPNTNKPLHLGHLRNGVIGTIIANLLRNSGASVLRADCVNDRGIHIVQSMIAYRHRGDGQTPETTGEKGDHFVGRFYVEFGKMKKEAENEFWSQPENIIWLQEHQIDPNQPTKSQAKEMERHFEENSPLIVETHQMLQLWEAADPEIRALWSKMNGWVYQGFAVTNDRAGFGFDRVYYESDTYTLGRTIIQQNAENGIGTKGKGQSIFIDMGDTGLNGGRDHELPVILIRTDGTSVYITQDVGLAITRFQQESGLTRIIYVVAREQELHFQRVFELLRQYGYPWHDSLFHLSYGMVHLPSGRMKSREGTVVDADDLMDQLHQLALAAINQTGQPTLAPTASEIDQRAEAIALGALRFYLASITPHKDTTFNPEESISFEGKTGPYLQYACARIAAIERKVFESGLTAATSAENELNEDEFSLVKALGNYPMITERAADQYDPSVLAAGLHGIAKAFSVFYTNCPVIQDTSYYNPTRLALCQATRKVLTHGLELLGIPVLERM